MVRGPFALTDNYNFSSDHRRRLTFFTTNLGFAERIPVSIDVVSIQIGGNSYAVESVGPNATVSGSQVTFRVPDLSPNTYTLGLKVRGVNSTNNPNLTIVATSPSSPSESSAKVTNDKSGASQSLSYLFYPLRKMFQ
jgi:hypothetical protein